MSILKMSLRGAVRRSNPKSGLSKGLLRFARNDGRLEFIFGFIIVKKLWL